MSYKQELETMKHIAKANGYKAEMVNKLTLKKKRKQVFIPHIWICAPEDGVFLPLQPHANLLKMSVKIALKGVHPKLFSESKDLIMPKFH